MPRVKPVQREGTGEITLRKIARSSGKPVDLVRRILREDPTLMADKDVKDRVFSTARSLGYAFGKLRLSKRLDLRLETTASILRKIEENPDWDRTQIVAHLKSVVDLADRVQTRMYGQDR